MDEIEVDELVHETDAAWLFVINGTEIWLPKSKCEYEESDSYVSVPRWLVEAKRREGFDI